MMNRFAKVIVVGIIVGILDFHYQEALPKLFESLFGTEASRLLIIPLMAAVLLPWYLLSIFTFQLYNKDGLARVILGTISIFLIAVFSYYSYYILLVMLFNYGSFFGSIESFQSLNGMKDAIQRLFLPGIIEWSAGAIIGGFLLSPLNYLLHTLIDKVRKKFEREVRAPD